MTFNTISASFDTPAEITQEVLHPLTPGTTYLLTLDVYVYNPEGDHCTVYYQTNYYLFKATAYSSAGSFHVTEHLTGTITASGSTAPNLFMLGCTCYGTSVTPSPPSCTFDNVALSLSV